MHHTTTIASYLFPCGIHQMNWRGGLQWIRESQLESIEVKADAIVVANLTEAAGCDELGVSHQYSST